MSAIKTMLQTAIPPAQLLSLLFFFAVIVLSILWIACVLMSTRKNPPPRVESSKITHPGYREPTPPKETEAFEPGPIRERIITERVLVVCPYCGAKNEQGLLKCRKCSAEI